MSNATYGGSIKMWAGSLISVFAFREDDDVRSGEGRLAPATNGLHFVNNSTSSTGMPTDVCSDVESGQLGRDA